MKLTDKEKIKAEIKRQIAELLPTIEKIGIVGGMAVKRHLESILSFIDSMQEEPVSNPIDFEKELYKAFGQVKDFTLGMRIAKWFYDMGKNSHEPVSEDLEKSAEESRRKIRPLFESIKESTGEPVSAYDQHDMVAMFKAGAQWQKEHLWKPADGDDLPEYEREVVVFTQDFPNDAGIMSVAIGHRPNPEGWDGKSLSTGKVEHYTPKTYDKGGWNIPNVKYWLDCLMPKEIMSKAEKFIEANTRNCSNLMQVPTLDEKGNIVPEAHPWLTPDKALEAVEIAREEELEYVKYQLELRLPETLDYNGYR